MSEQVLIKKDKKKAKQLTSELKKFREFWKQAAKDLNGMVIDLASKQWAMGKFLVKKSQEAKKIFSKNLIPLNYMEAARAMGQDYSTHTLQAYALFYERIPDLASRLKASQMPIKIYMIVSQAKNLLPKLDELEKRWQSGEWKTVKEFYKWVYPEKELTPIDLAHRFQTNWASWRNNVDEFLEMEIDELDDEEASMLLTDLGVLAFETLPRLASAIAKETKVKPDERIMKLMKLR